MTKAKVLITAQNKTDRAFAAVNKNVKNVTRNLLSAKGAFTGFIGVAVINQLASAAKDAIEFNDAIAKTADKLGISTTALQEFRFVAGRTGVESGVLEKGIQNMVRGIADFSQGTGEAKDALEGLNLKSEDLINLSPDQQFKLIADRLNSVTNNTEKLSIAYDLFGGRATALINTLNLGADGINRLQQEARAAGTIIDEELIRKSEVLNDKWDTLSDSISARFRKGFVRFADLFIDTSTATEQLNAALERKGDILKRLNEANISDSRQRNLAIKMTKKEFDENEKLIASLERKLEVENSKQDNGGGSSNEIDKVFELQNAKRMANALQLLDEQNFIDQQFSLEQEKDDKLNSLYETRAAKKVNAETKANEIILQGERSTVDMMLQLGNLLGSENSKLQKIMLITTAAVAASRTIAASYTEAGLIKASYAALGPAGIAAGAGLAAKAIIQGKVRAGLIGASAAVKIAGAREHGGPVIAGRSYLVGEKRPEIFTPNSSGKITNINNSGGDKIANITFVLGEVGDFEEKIQNSRALIFNTVLDAMNESGVSFS